MNAVAQAVMLRETGGPEVLRTENVEVKRPQLGELPLGIPP